MAKIREGSLHAAARRFDSTGRRIGPEFQISTATEGPQAGAVLGIDGDDDFVVAWSDASTGSPEVFARRFSTVAVLDIDGDGSTNPLTDGILVLRFLFGFSGATLLSGAVDPDCVRCDAAAIDAYLQTLI